jgi:hypothetical protein
MEDEGEGGKKMVKKRLRSRKKGNMMKRMTIIVVMKRMKRSHMKILNQRTRLHNHHVQSQSVH